MSILKVTQPIRFRFHPEKAVQAAAVLLKLHGKRMKYLGLLKMLYMADRMALKILEQPITGDCYFSTQYGPVLSGVYELIKGKSVDNALAIWSKFISSRNGNKDSDITLLNDPGNSELCEEEEEILNRVYNKFSTINPFNVAEWTHNLPEWQKPESINSAIPIHVEDILKSIGKSEEEIEEIRQEASREAYLDEVLNN